MYVCMYIYVYICTFMCVYIYSYIYIYVYIYIYMYICIYIFTHIYIHIYIYIYTNIFVYISMNLYMHRSVHLYTHICIFPRVEWRRLKLKLKVETQYRQSLYSGSSDVSWFEWESLAIFRVPEFFEKCHNPRQNDINQLAENARVVAPMGWLRLVGSIKL